MVRKNTFSSYVFANGTEMEIDSYSVELSSIKRKMTFEVLTSEARWRAKVAMN